MRQLSNPQKLIYDMEKYAGGAIAVICGSVLLEGRRGTDELTHAVHEIFRLNEALRTRIVERDGQPRQEIVEFTPQPVKVLHFGNRDAFTAYAEEQAKTPVSLDGALCEIQIVLLPEHFGLLAKCHHMVGDAWTLTLIASQLCALLAGEEPPAYPYSDYVESETAYAQSSRREKDRAFFLEQFQHYPEAVYLSEKPGDSFAAKRATFRIAAEQTTLLRTYAKEHNTSPFVLCLTALSLYFSRVKDNVEAFYIGTPILNRGSFREKHTMGMFINTVPVLAQVDYTRSFAEHLAAMQGEVLSVLRHQKFHYNDILAAVRQEYGFTEKLYDVVLSYQNAAVTGAEQGVETTWYHSGAQTESLQLHIDDRDGEGAFRIHLDYRTDKFTGREIERMYGHILNLLLDAVSDDTKTPDQLALLSTEERKQLLVAFNDTAADYPKDKCVHALFEEQVEKTPDKTAVIACDRTLTYRELNEEANRIAHGLMERGVKPGDIVAFALPRNSHLIPTMFGILKAGAAYLPIDPDYPQERKDILLRESAAKYFITEGSLAPLLTCKPVKQSVLGNDLYCALHTSGSTGTPKLSTLTHHGILSFSAANAHWYQDIRSVCAFTICTFDAFILETVIPLLHGVPVALASEDEIFNQSSLERLLEEHPQTLMFATPTKLKQYIESTIQKGIWKNVIRFIVGGEVFSEELLSLIHTANRTAEAVNIYGPTETTICATTTVVEPGNITIGRPIANTQIYIVDRHLRPVPIGVTGELCIAGDGVGAGYLNRRSLTAEKFIDNPFGPGKLYKTGDLAYWREDGNIVYVGRNDFQVKIRGLRIELGEIESAIAGVEGVSQAVVVVRKDETGRQLICAFYTETAPVELDTIKAALQERLPRYMMPHAFTKLDILPLTPSGKVDRKALPQVDLSAIVSEVEYVAPSTPEEKALAAAVSQVLGLERAGMLDNFFDLGGDSLKAIELTAALERSGYHTQVKTIFEAKALGELAPLLTAVQPETEGEIPTGDIPATPAQMRVYTAQSISGGTAYNVPYAFRVKELDPARLQAAIDQLVDRHEILRTRFENRGGIIMQVAEDTARCQVEELENEDISAFIRPFDLGTAPLLRVGYYKNTVLLDMHHIITDGGSMPVFLRELNELYMGRELTAQPVPYRAFAAKPQGSPEDEAYWLDLFADEPPVLELNTDYPRPAKQSYEGAAIYETIPAALHEQVCGICRKLGVTPYAFYLGAFQILLSKFSGSEDIVVGTPASGRSGKFLGTLGMFVNTLALRGRPEGEKTVHNFLQEVKGAAVDALAHQNYPYGELVKKLGIHAEGRNPLFDVMFAYQSEEMTDVVFGDKPAGLLPIPVTTSKYDFTFNLMPRSGDVVLMVEYCTILFKEITIQRYMEGYKLLLSQMLESGKTIKELSAMNETERHTLLADFNDTAADYPRDKCVHTLFEEQVERTPDKTAVIACDRTLTYQELNEEANRIAHGLMEQDVQPGDIVAFALPRNSHLIPTMFGILKAGAAYLPIDPDYPQERISYMLEDSGAKVFATETELPNLLKNENTQNPELRLSSKNLCYCIYTSGSTGHPKGVIITHQSTVNFCCDSRSAFHHSLKSHCDCVLATNNIVFDITIQEIHLPLLNGKQVFLARDSIDIAEEEIQKLRVICNSLALITTPTKISLFLNNKTISSIFKQCKTVMVGAEQFPPSLYQQIKGTTDAQIFNGYGPTEATCGSCYHDALSDDITIGRPIANTQIYIVDRHINPVPLGVTGELCIAGDGVGAGYLNRPELTAEKFISNPFGPGKLYKTGDLAYWREDGNIVYVGRNDFQVKIRGLRIELGEIENAIASVPDVSQSVVVVRKGETGRQLICAFYTETAPVELDAIKSALWERLPRYMMPHIFTRLDALPLTPSGKVDRKALPQVNLSAIVSEVEYVAPSTPEEKALATVVAQVLGLEQVGMLDNFFDLGGDSLKAIELTAALERAGYHVEVKTIFEAETLGELAAHLTAAQPETEDAIPTGDIPATPAQMRVYTAQSMSGGTAYNVPYAFRVKELDPIRLQTAVDKLVTRHESLRTRFENRDGVIMQVVDDIARCVVERLPSDDLLTFIRPFDLETAPLLRVGYCRNTVFLDMHHIITDGGSMPVFLRELNELYMGRELNTQPVQYREFAAREQDSPEDEAYWLGVFADEPPILELNTDYPRPAKQSYEGAAVYESISAELHAQICKKCKTLGITPYAYYLGAFQILLSKFSGSEDIVVGTPASGRSGKFLNTLGMFVNTLALRGKPEGEKTVRDFLVEIKTASVDALTHQGYPYGELVKKIGIHAEGRNPLFDVMFAYQSEEMTEVVFGDSPAELLPIPVTTSKYDFTFNLMPRNEDVVLMVEYCTALFKEATIQRLIEGYKFLLTQMLNAENLLKNLTAITKVEKQQLLFGFNNTAVEYPREKCVHTLFEEQVEKTPDKAAVIACDRTLTYRELNEEANRIAHGLMKQGVKPGDIVAFALPRNSHIIPTMFGILKAGAAYLPIDPDYPQERKDTLLRESAAKYFITEDSLTPLLACEPVKQSVLGNDLYCALHTSGSTGTPKLSTLTHHGILSFSVANAHWYQNICSVCAFTICTFDAFILETVIPLLHGVPVALASEDEIFNQSSLEALLGKHPQTLMFATPTKLKQYIENTIQKDIWKNVIRFIVGGEMFSEELLSLIHTADRTAEAVNIYGPTETTICATTMIVESGNITIGKPIANTQVYIVDKYGNLVPIGATGELCIAGDGVGAGYLNRPELTAEKFIDNPFGSGKLYKTGDLAYWREDGNIVYVGRNDFQVKIRGLRIELGEIENAIAGVEGVSQAVVVVRKDETGRQLICAFYTQTTPVELDTIKAAIRERLPRYMMPHIFTKLVALPLTSSGKVDRKNLPEVDLTACQSDAEYVPPQGQIEKALAAIMEGVLGYSPVGREDNFFDLGGDSLKAIEFVSKAHTEGIYFALQNVFDYPTVGALREYIESGDKSAISYHDVDFTAVNAALAKNRMEIKYIPGKTEVGDLLLTGATGFLGIHLLADYLEHDSGTAYCLVRGQNQADSEARLRKLLNFYFGDKYTHLLGGRIQVLCGDLQKDGFGLTEPNYQVLLERVDTVINAAASVKHYGSYRFFREVNVGSVKKLIVFCQQERAKLIHISTLSVSGNDFDTFDGYVSDTEKHFYEDSLYIGQPLENVYARSKFEAEKLVLEAVSAGLPACIMRMGNLTNRASDGVFQINHETNAAAQRIKGIIELGLVPEYLFEDNMYVEFTPIDEAAWAIMLLTRHFDPARTVFHINSTKVVYLDKLLELFTTLGHPVRAVPGKEFASALRETAKQAGMEHIFETFINDLDEQDRLNYDSNIRIENAFTEEYLQKLGFTWGEIGLGYLRKYVEYFKKIEYWEGA